MGLKNCSSNRLPLMKSVINDTCRISRIFLQVRAERNGEKCAVRNGERERESGRGNTVCGSTETVNIYGIAWR